MRERKYGAGFCDAMTREHQANFERVRTLLAPLDDSLRERAFLLGRIGYADFALYGQLWYLAFTGEMKIPLDLPSLRAFYERMDRISSVLEPNA